MSTRSRIAIEVSEKEVDYIKHHWKANFDEHGLDNLELKIPYDDVLDASKRYVSIYCHYDGYVGFIHEEKLHEGTGFVLNEHLTNRQDIIDLIAKGDHSYVHSDGYGNLDTKSYLEWRGDNVPPRGSYTIDDLLGLGRDCTAEYVYLFDRYDKWQVREVGDNINFFQPLENVISGLEGRLESKLDINR